MTFTLNPVYVYLFVNTVLAIMLILNIRKVDKLKEEVNSIWQQIAVFAIASSGAFSKLEKKIDEKQDGKPGEE